MKIIDAHIHYAGWDGFNETAAESGQVNTVEGVADNFRKNGVVMAVAMGAGRNGEDPAVCRPMTPNRLLRRSRFRSDHAGKHEAVA